mmetsp:Transcript_16455/g.24275  ORF Transcript_16455/g.24275 Transcript_16455/m.24275 type:complete len:665 (+) Transcript_16455:51-2045(+)|eukprot:CAMPEP_0194207238 /NCGR_PEP_ID=MMETSP0156-20130528/6037_1 /TAXON_ID=33649 /ORGANISM="Thalassionema nitzschioides, Strain L26-B" /LENGTH=664 /DNA_ID=CAMNT_0038933951 /DNA_START=35 /DNA_END=2029 /DNA_ORIENTATION=-
MKTIEATSLTAAAALLNVLCVIPAYGFGIAPAGQRAVSAPTISRVGPSTGYVVTSTQLGAEPIKITMPALSSTMKEGRVVSWLKNEGDEIEAGEAIMVVESDKADMDVEAFEDGYLAKIITEEGESAPVGEVVALIAALESEIGDVVSSYEGGSAAPAADNSAAEDAAPAAGDTPAAAAPDVSFSQIDMPALSSTMKEGKVVSWLKAEGDPISSGEAIMVVESDKADMDVEAFEDGYLAAIITEEGDSGAVGAPVALIAENESDIPALKAYAATLSGFVAAPAVAAPATSAPAAPKPAVSKPAAGGAAASGDRVVASPLAKKRAEELGFDISTIAGTGPNGRITAGDVEAAAASGAPAAKKASAEPSKPAWTPAAGVIAATPTARAFAKKAKLDLATITGTGEFGRVTIDDVKMATGEKKPERKRASQPGAEVVELPGDFVAFTGMQKAVSNNMMATLNIPEFRVSREIQMDAFDSLYQSLKPKGVTVSAMLAKAVALAIAKHPIINSSYSEQGGAPGIQYNQDINIAMAVAIDGGLITPTLKYANERSMVELGENWKELVGKAKTGTLSPDEYNSGTFTISNMGMFGVTDFGAILPAGSGGILAIGGTQETIVPDSAAVLGLKKVKKMKVTLTCDHRQIYGADAALFLKTLADIMENKLDMLS